MRKWMQWVVGLLVMLALVAPGMTRTVAADGVVPVDMAMLGPEEQALWKDLSAARAASNLKPLTLDANVTTLAHDRSADMAARSYLDHTNPDGKTLLDLLPNYGITYHAIGEIIAFNLGVADSGDEAAKGFIASPVHHAIFFNDRFTAAGVGHAVDANGKHYFTVIVLS